jgi:CBS domain-containing protein
MANVVVNRVKEFLRKYPPFSFLSEQMLQQVAQEVELMFYPEGEYLFFQGEPAKNFFFVVKEGFINLTENRNGVTHIMEYCDEGDVFGVLALLGKRPYVLNAFASEDTLLYAIPVGIFETILQENSKVSLYFATGFASGKVVVRSDLAQSQMAGRLFKQQVVGNKVTVFSEQFPFRYSNDVLTCLSEETIEDAAKKMSERGVGSIVVVDESRHPLGIITDKDLRNRVLAAEKSPTQPVDEIMSQPLITIDQQCDFSSAYLAMIKNRIHHLIITEDGSSKSPVRGIVSDHDILLSQGYSPSVIIHTLVKSWKVEELARLREQAESLLTSYLENEMSINFLSRIISEINDVLIQRAILIAKRKHDADHQDVCDVDFCFLALGSEGRGEQLLRTDMDNALVYEDSERRDPQRTRSYLLKIGQEVVDILTACGIQPCPADIMVNNPKWCQPLSVWKSYFDRWILNPDPDALLKASIFFDYRPVFGAEALANAITTHIYDLVGERKIFLNFLAKQALMNPAPLGFFRNFLVEKSGEHQDKFDIKLRAMMPLVDAARLLVLSHHVVGINNTFKRFERLAELEPQHREIFKEAGKAYEIFMRIRVIEGLKAGGSGRFIHPDHLGKLQRQLLKNAFVPIDELQRIIAVRFQLNLLG